MVRARRARVQVPPPHRFSLAVSSHRDTRAILLYSPKFGHSQKEPFMEMLALVD